MNIKRAGFIGCCLLSMTAGAFLYHKFLKYQPLKAAPPARSHKKKPKDKVSRTKK